MVGERGVRLRQARRPGVAALIQVLSLLGHITSLLWFPFGLPPDSLLLDACGS